MMSDALRLQLIIKNRLDGSIQHQIGVDVDIIPGNPVEAVAEIPSEHFKEGMPLMVRGKGRSASIAITDMVENLLSDARYQPYRDRNKK